MYTNMSEEREREGNFGFIVGKCFNWLLRMVSKNTSNEFTQLTVRALHLDHTNRMQERVGRGAARVHRYFVGYFVFNASNFILKLDCKTFLCDNGRFACPESESARKWNGYKNQQVDTYRYALCNCNDLIPHVCVCVCRTHVVFVAQSKINYDKRQKKKLKI